MAQPAAHRGRVLRDSLLPGYTPVQHVPVQSTRSGRGQECAMWLREAVNMRREAAPVCRGILLDSQLFFKVRKCTLKHCYVYIINVYTGNIVICYQVCAVYHYVCNVSVCCFHGTGSTVGLFTSSSPQTMSNNTLCSDIKMTLSNRNFEAPL